MRAATTPMIIIRVNTTMMYMAVMSNSVSMSDWLIRCARFHFVLFLYTARGQSLFLYDNLGSL